MEATVPIYGMRTTAFRGSRSYFATPLVCTEQKVLPSWWPNRIKQIDYGEDQVAHVADPRLQSSLYGSKWFLSLPPEAQAVRLEELLVASPDTPKWVQELVAKLPSEEDYSLGAPKKVLEGYRECLNPQLLRKEANVGLCLLNDLISQDLDRLVDSTFVAISIIRAFNRTGIVDFGFLCKLSKRLIRLWEPRSRVLTGDVFNKYVTPPEKLGSVRDLLTALYEWDKYMVHAETWSRMLMARVKEDKREHIKILMKSDSTFPFGAEGMQFLEHGAGQIYQNILESLEPSFETMSAAEVVGVVNILRRLWPGQAEKEQEEWCVRLHTRATSLRADYPDKDWKALEEWLLPRLPVAAGEKQQPKAKRFWFF